MIQGAGQGPVRGANPGLTAGGQRERADRMPQRLGRIERGEGTRAPTARRGRHLAGLALALIGVVAMAGSADPASAQASDTGGPLGVFETENLVRQIHYEGLPEAEAARIGADGVARLVEMLADPAESRSHARILHALGIVGGPEAYAAIVGWAAAQPTSGEIDRDRFRAWQALPFALGRLAPRDPRALRDLAACFEAKPPGWTFRHFDAARLQALERRAAAGALAETGLPEAQRILDSVERSAADPALVGHVRAVRAEAASRAAGGAR